MDRIRWIQFVGLLTSITLIAVGLVEVVVR